MNGIIETNNIDVEDMIYEIRGKQVMLDYDLARLFKITTGNLNKAVKRNISKFPIDFMFEISLDEYKFLMFQNGISKIDYRKINKALPKAFTEQGIAMLATILKSDIAISVSINIMRAFVAMRKYISTNLIEQKYINNLVLKNDERLSLVENTLDKMNEKEKINSIFFEGQIYDTYSLLIDILNKAKSKIIIIDNYAGKELLDIIKNIKVPVTIVSSEVDKILKNKYSNQYDNVTFIDNKSFHDRFILVDNTILYHCGASFKDLGKKCFAINKIEDKELINKIICKIVCVP